MAEEIERIYIIPLKKTGYKSSKAAPSAVKRVKSYLTRHMKVEEKDIWIDDSLNNALWSKGKYKLAGKIRVKAVKFDDGVVEAYLPEIEFKKSRRELLKEEKAKKEPILKKEEMEEAEGETGAEDYEIAPAADGDVKIKKKKASKAEKDKKPKEKKPAKAKKEHEEKETKKKSAKKKPAAKKATKKESKAKTMKKAASKPKAAKKKSTSKKKK
jgi:large subunit ribosomal protein L31e